MTIFAANNAALQEAVQIKGHLGIVNDQYNSDGVGENDIIIIAVCRTAGVV